MWTWGYIRSGEELWQSLLDHANAKFTFQFELDVDRRRLKPMAHEISTQYALGSVPDDAVDTCAAVLRSTGFFDMLDGDGDGDAVRGLAMCGVCTSVYLARADAVVCAPGGGNALEPAGGHNMLAQ